MFNDFMKLAFQNLSKRRMRSWLTMIGIFIGIALLVSLVSLGQGLQKSLNDEFEKLGGDKLFVMPKGGFGQTGDLNTVTLKDGDVRATKSALGVADAVGFRYSTARVEFNQQVKYVFVIAWPIGNSLFDEYMDQYDVLSGRKLRNGDDNKVYLASMYYNADFFKPNLKLRDKIELNNNEFKVVGFIDSVGNSQDDTNIYITEKAYDRLYPDSDSYGQIMIKIRSGEDPSTVAENVAKKLRKYRNLDEGKEDFSVNTAEDLVESFSSILTIVQIFLFAIAAISIAVGGIGITNTMYTAVLERTKEIGIMKAIGAKNSIVLTIFVIESGLLGLAGGAIGIAIGISISKLVELGIHATGNTLINAYFPWYLIVGSLLFSYTIGTASGIMPAIQASKQKPVDSLRYE